MSSTELHLKTQLAELQRQYDTLTKRVAAVVTDIGRELDSERKLVLDTRRADLVTERDQITADMTRIEQQLASAGSVTTQDAATIPAQTAPVAPASPEDHASLSDPAGDKDSSSGSSPAAPSPKPPTRLRASWPTFIWAIIGALLVAMVGILFFNQARCLIEYRLTEAVVGLIVFLAAGAGAVFSNLAPLIIRRPLQAFYGGIALAFLILILLIMLMPQIGAEYCRLIGSPISQPATPIPTKVSPSGPAPIPMVTLTTITQPDPTAATTPSIGSTWISPVDGMVQVYVPAGEFLMGSEDSDGDADSNEKPQRKITLDAFWIDRTEVTNAMFARFVAASGHKTYAEKTGIAYVFNTVSKKLEGKSGADWQHPRGSGSHIAGLEQHPVVQVNWDDAAAYCFWAGRRLPTEAEWEKAARGVDGRRFPWGNQDVAGDLLNFGDRNLRTDQADKNVDDGYQFTAPAGSYPKGANPYGGWDMAGNVWEWVADWQDDGYYAGAPVQNPKGPDSGKYLGLRGGSWFDDQEGVRATNRGKLLPEGRSVIVGFRCVCSD